jgi:3-methyladenine DNA glycosylase AlkD
MKKEMNPLVSELRKEMKKASDSAKAVPMQAYMKTSQPFYGIPATPHRQIFRQAIRKHPIQSRDEYEQAIEELWAGKYREEMYQALEIAEHCITYQDEREWAFYEKLVQTATNWDTLDWIVGKLVSTLVLRHRKFERVLKIWADSENFWVRRASLLAHLHHKEETNTKLLAATILKLAHEKEFFIRKAIGWVLRDYSYTNPDWVREFVEKHETELSGLSRREAFKQILRKQKSG